MEQNYNSDELEIDLMEIFMVIMHWIWMIILVAVIGGVAAFLYSKFMITPTYESTSRIVVLNQTSENLTYNDLSMSTQLTNDYPELITSRYVVESVIDTFGLDTTYEKFVSKVNVSTTTNSRIIDITLTDTDPLMAKELVDELREVASKRIEEVMQIDAVNVVDEGNVPTSPAGPNVMKWTLIGILAGGFLSVAVVIVLYLLDDTIKSSEDIEKYL
ncbi:MAG: protein-tyrosine kinase, partial [Lachnospiraceae bacterium]|nr:protein-tyrosine kinase [Lachnospiraceae bacterium]